MSIKVLIADDHDVIRSGLTSMFKGTDIEVVGEANDGEKAADATAKLKPDVVVLDIQMPHLDGLGALKRIRSECPDARVMMMSTFDNPTYVARSVALGAQEYMLKGSPRKEVIKAIQRTAKDEAPESDSIIARIRKAMSRRRDPNDEIPLTNREVQVLRHIALGLSNREIAHSLEISIETVKEHVQNILRKLRVNDRTQAAVWAVKRDIV